MAHTLGRVEKELLIGDTKTHRSRRNLPLKPTLVAALRRHRIEQNKERLLAGNQWHDNGLVFCNEFGQKLDPQNLLRLVKRAAEDKDATVRKLRHSAATAWLDSGVHIKAVSDLLGHSSITITGDIYGHTSDTAARAAVNLLGEQLRAVMARILGVKAGWSVDWGTGTATVPHAMLWSAQMPNRASGC